MAPILGPDPSTRNGANRTSNMHYSISSIDPNQHLLRIDLHAKGIEGDEFELRMPAWRPGRYQMAHFARNILQMEAYDERGGHLELFKTEKDRWTIKTRGSDEVTIRYTYYAHEMNAGSTYVDEEQLYLNPVSSLVYVPEKEEVPHRIELKLPEEDQVATALKKEGEKTFMAPNMQALMDGPLIASSGLKHHSFEREGARFHLWFQGECKPSFQRIESDFKNFISEQVAAFGKFPTPEYHFLFQVLPYRTFHGVEHEHSTVIVLGPSYRVMDPESGYETLVAVSSHELYHTWNVKRIRASAMMPYDFSKENYTRLGYVAEGVTTYMGDLMLLRSGFYSLERYLEKLAGLLQRHYDNPGRHNLSVADSSFDTWLDGYDHEVPRRKVSIYNEGALIAFMLDVTILRQSGNTRSLDDLMKRLYENFAEHGKGFDESDLQRTAEELAESSLENLFSDHIGGTADYTERLEACFEYLGIRWKAPPSEKYHQARLGIRIHEEEGQPVVWAIYPGSPAEKAGLEPGDRVIGINGYEVSAATFEGWCSYFSEEPIGILLARDGRILNRILKSGEELFFRVHKLIPESEMTAANERSFLAWSGSKLP
ncbi:MAG: M61 family metallopeptidase [Flavobacteriales bacterium]